MHRRWPALNGSQLLADPAGDAALLRRFSDEGDAAAFECLLRRHGGMVLGTCERILRDRHMAEDAYQATFLILARRAGTVRGVLPAWLHRVTVRVCLRLKKRHPERLVVELAGREEPIAVEQRELSAILDAEIGRLPEKHRRVIVLCYLQNLTVEAAAQQLGIPRGTVLSRLDAARRKLQVALGRRGIAPVAILAVTLIHAAPSTALVRTAQHAALAFTTGSATTPITQLAIEVLHMTTRKWIAGTALGMVALAFASTGVGLLTANGPISSQAVAQAPAAPPAPKPAEDARKAEILRQVLLLEKTDVELCERIDNLSKTIIKKSVLRDSEVSARAYERAIEKNDDLMIEWEASFGEAQLVGMRKNAAERRAKLVERFRTASRVLEEQKLLDDELQVLREFRKAVLKQKLTLKLEIEGVTLPVEPKK